MKFAGIIYVNGFRQAGDRPRNFDIALLQPGVFLQDRLRKADAGPQRRRMIQRQIEPSHNASANINRQRQYRPVDRVPGDLVDDNDVDHGVVDLDDVQGSFSPIFADDRIEDRRGRISALAFRHKQSSV